MKTLPDLAQVKRRGCLQRGVPEADCESVAEHSHAVATYCLVSAPIVGKNVLDQDSELIPHKSGGQKLLKLHWFMT